MMKNRSPSKTQVNYFKSVKKFLDPSNSHELVHIVQSVENFLALPISFTNIRAREELMKDLITILRNGGNTSALVNEDGIQNTKLEQVLNELSNLYQQAPAPVDDVISTYILNCEKVTTPPIKGLIGLIHRFTNSFKKENASIEDIKNHLMLIYQYISALQSIGYTIEDFQLPEQDNKAFKKDIRKYTKKAYEDAFKVLLALNTPLPRIINLAKKITLPIFLFNPPYSWEDNATYYDLIQHHHKQTVALIGFIEIFEFLYQIGTPLAKLLTLSKTPISTHYGFYTPIHNDPITILSLLEKAGASDEQLSSALSTNNISEPRYNNALSMLLPFNEIEKLDYILKHFLKSYSSKLAIFTFRTKDKTLKELAYDLKLPDIVNLLEKHGDITPIITKANRVAISKASANGHAIFSSNEAENHTGSAVPKTNRPLFSPQSTTRTRVFPKSPQSKDNASVSNAKPPRAEGFSP